MVEQARSRMTTCPRPGCQVRIHRSLFACRNDWWALSKPVRNAIYATSLAPFTPERNAAVRAAMEEWQHAS